MKKDLKNKLAYGAMLLAMVVLSVGCSKDAPLVDKPVVEEEQPTKNYPEYELYTTGDQFLVAYSYLSSVITYDESGAPFGSQIVCGLGVNLWDFGQASEEVEYTFGDRTIVTTPLTSTRIVGMDVITNADYDDAHPAGSSVADIMELHYIGDDNKYYSRMDLTDYFTTYPGLDIKADPESASGFVFRLSAKTMPLEENYIARTDLAYLEPGYSTLAVDFTLVFTLADGTVVEITDLLPTQMI